MSFFAIPCCGAGLGEAKDALWFLRRLRLTYRPAIKNNPWIMPPEAIVERGGGVFKYLLDVEKAEEAGARVELLQLLKVVLVGSSKAGKTRYARVRMCVIMDGRPLYTLSSLILVTCIRWLVGFICATPFMALFSALEWFYRPSRHARSNSRTLVPCPSVLSRHEVGA